MIYVLSSNIHLGCYIQSCDSKQTRLYDSIIQIHIIRSYSLDACTYG